MKMKVYKTISTLEEIRQHKAYLQRKNKKREARLQEKLNDFSGYLSWENAMASVGSFISAWVMNLVPDFIGSFGSEGNFTNMAGNFFSGKKKWLWIVLGIATAGLATYYFTSKYRRRNEPEG